MFLGENRNTSCPRDWQTCYSLFTLIFSNPGTHAEYNVALHMSLSLATALLFEYFRALKGQDLLLYHFNKQIHSQRAPYCFDFSWCFKRVIPIESFVVRVVLYHTWPPRHDKLMKWISRIVKGDCKRLKNTMNKLFHRITP